MSSCCDYIIQSELKKNIKRLLKGSGYLHHFLLPKIEECNFIDDNEYNEELFMIEYDIKKLLNSNDNNLKGIWIDKYLKKQYNLEFDNYINNLVDKFIIDDNILDLE